jgi:hypothetical protein
MIQVHPTTCPTTNLKQLRHLTQLHKQKKIKIEREKAGKLHYPTILPEISALSSAQLRD